MSIYTDDSQLFDHSYFFTTFRTPSQQIKTGIMKVENTQLQKHMCELKLYQSKYPSFFQQFVCRSGIII